MRFPNFRFSLAQLVLWMALAAILVSAGILIGQPSGYTQYIVSALEFSPDGKSLAASLYEFRTVHATGQLAGADARKSFLLFSLPRLYRTRVLDRTTRPGVLDIAWSVKK